MKKFIVLYDSPKEAMAKMAKSTPEELQAGQKAWMDWFESIGDGLVERGDFFMKGTSITSSGSEDSSGKVTGYSIIQAESIEEAENMLKNHPHIEWYDGCAVEVYEPRAMKR